MSFPLLALIFIVSISLCKCQSQSLSINEPLTGEFELGSDLFMSYSRMGFGEYPTGPVTVTLLRAGSGPDCSCLPADLPDCGALLQESASLLYTYTYILLDGETAPTLLGTNLYFQVNTSTVVSPPSCTPPNILTIVHGTMLASKLQAIIMDPPH